MDLLEAQAFWTLGMLPREKIPAIAQRALERGMDDPSLRILAGLTNAELDEATPLFEKTVNSMGIRKLSKQEALDICADCLSRRILDGAISPYDGAKQIFRASVEVEGRNHDVDPFIYAADEYEDRPEDRGFFEAAIVLEAKRRLGR